MTEYIHYTFATFPKDTLRLQQEKPLANYLSNIDMQNVNQF